ncbi:endonuclease domain-containing protein [Streptomyces sp. NPDC056656]|uniref:endonuclease domain-containing protein n=1 Tax=Streptomyces sp. NPDC056656 TaxID=3345895 RepID=UPI003683C694
MCAACMTVRATVWDHCHTHGFVRAPLCNRCNTRYWRGWEPRQGRSAANHNLDASYYRRCPNYSDARRACSG